MSERSVRIPVNKAGERVDVALADLLGETRSAIARAIRQQRITHGTNNTLVRKNSALVTEGDTYIVQPAPDVTPVGDSVPVDFATQIIFEDDSILVINKAAGQVVHPSAGQTQNTIAQAIIAREPLIANARYDDTPLSQARAGIVHRLDKATSGILVIAKTHAALIALQQQFKDRTIKKEYVAIVAGTLREPCVVDAAIARHPVKRQRQAVVPTGKPATTTFTPLSQGAPDGKPITYVQANPITGRTHQIRVHLSHIHHPILGDPVYADKNSVNISHALAVHNLLLHARVITFTHPMTGTVVTYHAEAPAYFKALLERF